MTTPITITDPVGINEIAERLGVDRATVNSWRNRAKKDAVRRRPLPEPDIILTKTPVWAWNRILAWALETNRVPVAAP